MRLIDLDPEWILVRTGEPGCWTLAEPRDGMRIVGVKFQCPCVRCNGQKGALAVLFANPPDGGAPAPDDEAIVGNCEGRRWTLASGSAFSNLSITPSINAEPCWHGFITDGEVKP